MDSNLPTVLAYLGAASLASLIAWFVFAPRMLERFKQPRTTETPAHGSGTLPPVLAVKLEQTAYLIRSGLLTQDKWLTFIMGQKENPSTSFPEQEHERISTAVILAQEAMLRQGWDIASRHLLQDHLSRINVRELTTLTTNALCAPANPEHSATS